MDLIINSNNISRIIATEIHENNVSIFYIKTCLIRILVRLYLTDDDKKETSKLNDFIISFNKIFLAVDLSIQKNISFDIANSNSIINLATLNDFEKKNGELFFLGYKIDYFKTFCSEKMIAGEYTINKIINCNESYNNVPYIKILDITETPEYISFFTSDDNNIKERYYFKVDLLDKNLKESLNYNLEYDSDIEAEVTKNDIYYSIYKTGNSFNILSLSIWTIYKSHPLFGKHAFLELWCKNDSNKFYGIGHYSINPYLSILFAHGITDVYLEIGISIGEDDDHSIADMHNSILNVYKKMGFTAICYILEKDEILKKDEMLDNQYFEGYYLLMHLKITPALLIQQLLRDVTLEKISHIED